MPICISRGLTEKCDGDPSWKLQVVQLLAAGSGLGAGGLLVVVWLHRHAREALVWLDGQEWWIVCLVFLALYTAVAFPLTWGYLPLNMACGYHFGPARGVLVTGLEVALGIALAHTAMRHCSPCLIRAGRRQITALVPLRALLAALDAGAAHSFKLVAFSRLTPVPFGLQNALFAASRIRLPQYVGASALGLLPTQALNCYLGSTLRSMSEVVDPQQYSSPLLLLLAQGLLAVVLTLFLVRYARQQISKNLEPELNPSAFTTADV